MLTQVTDYVDQGLARFIDQYREKPRLAAFAASFLNRTQERENATWDVIQKRLLPNATGVQLDVLGKLVGQSRDGQADDTYRLYINVRIIINRSHGRRPAVMTILQMLEGARFEYGEAYPAAVSIRYLATTTIDASVLFALVALALAGGVALRMTFDTSNTRAARYGWTGNPNLNKSVGYGWTGDAALGGLQQFVLSNDQ